MSLEPSDPSDRCLGREEQLVFGQNLRAAREAKGLTQDQLAKLADVPQAEVSRIESGSVNTSLRRMAKLAKAVDVTVRDLLTPPGP